MNPRPAAGGVRSRALPRSRTLGALLLDHLTERDVRICIDVFEHRFLTNHQIYQLHFNSEYRARARTKQLYELGLLDRFRPPKHPGSWPWHYILDRAGADVVGGAVDVDTSKYFERNRLARLVHSRNLEHARNVNDFFSTLAFACRFTPEMRLSRWLGEVRSSLLCSGIVNPDGIGTVSTGHGPIDFFLELDRATERAGQLTGKLLDYDEAAIARHLPRILLFWFQLEAREQSAREVLRSSRVQIATATLERHLGSPLGSNWLPIGGEIRVPLLHLRDLIL
jgi:hypothetical protein